MLVGQLVILDALEEVPLDPLAVLIDLGKTEFRTNISNPLCLLVPPDGLFGILLKSVLSFVENLSEFVCRRCISLFGGTGKQFHSANRIEFNPVAPEMHSPQIELCDTISVV